MPDWILLDFARVALALTGAVTAAHQVSLVRRAATVGQRLRLVGVAVALTVLSASRLERLGEPPTWQFWAASVAIVLLAAGSWAWRHEIPAQPRPLGRRRAR